MFEIYSAPGQNASDLVTIDGKTRFTTDENGDISLGIDLPNGTYYMYEVKAPPGYKRLTQPIAVTVSDSGVTYMSPGAGDDAAQTAPLMPGVNAPVYMVTAVNELTDALQIIKIDAEHPDVTLQGAAFNLYLLPDGTDEAAITDSTTGIPDRSQLEIVTVSDNETLVSDSEGVIYFSNGLSPGTYYLFETEAPQGFACSKYPVKITVYDTGQVAYTQRDYNAGQTMTATLVTAGNRAPAVTVYVANATGFELPHTGGAGTWMYTTGGIALVCIAILTLGIILIRRRCERRNL